MSISDNYVPDVSAGNGVTVAFSGSWNVISAVYMVVQLQNTSTLAFTPLTLGTDYTLVFTSSGYTITCTVAPATGYNVIRSRNIAKTQIVPYRTSTGFQGLVEENSFDKITAITQDLQENVNRTLLFPIGTTASGSLPVPQDGYGLIWSGTTGTIVNTSVSMALLQSQATSLAAIETQIVTVAGISASVTAVAGNAANINTVAGISASVSTVAGINGNVTTVAGISGNVTTVAGISASVSTVAGIAAAVSTVAGISANVTSVAGNATNINAVATDLTNINAVATDLTNINAVAGDLTNINAVNTNATNINTVSGISGNVTTVAGISGNVTTVAGISGNVTTVAGISASVSTVASDHAIITTVAGDHAVITTVAGDHTPINTVATNIASVNTVATNMTSVINAANNIPKANLSATVAPTVNNDNTQGYSAGSLWTDTTHNQVYIASSVATGAANWIQAFSASALSGLSDVTITSVQNKDFLVYNGTKWANLAGANLSAVAGLTSAINAFPVFTGSGTAGLVTVTASTLVGMGATGNAAKIVLGTNLSMSGTTLNATGGGATSINGLSDAVHDTTNHNLTLGVNTAFGAAATHCIYIGDSTGNQANNTTGSADNVAIGYTTFAAQTGGFQNIAIGSRAMNAAITDSQNVAIGADALLVLNGASTTQNTAVGYASGNKISTGAGNTILGSQAGQTVTTGSSNTFIGSQTDCSSAAGQNRTSLGNQANCTADNTAQIGNGSLTVLTVGTSNTASVKALNTIKAYGSVTGATGARVLNDGFNVSSITDTAAGAITYNFTTSFADAVYTTLTNAQFTATTFAIANDRRIHTKLSGKAVGSCAFECLNQATTTNVLADPQSWDIAFLGKQ